MIFLTKEKPAGAIDSSNKTFTLSQLINEIDDVWVDGDIYLGVVIVTPGTGIFELADAPTTTIYVDYWITESGTIPAECFDAGGPIKPSVPKPCYC